MPRTFAARRLYAAMRALTATLVLFVFAQMAWAGGPTTFKTGNMLLSEIKEHPVTKAGAIGFITGVADTSYAAFCMPDGVIIAQLLDVTQAYLERNVATRQERAATLVVRAFVEAWPCR